MATRLIFSSEEALRLAMTSELVPTEVQGTPVRVRHEADGSLLVEPVQSLTRAQLGALSQAGVKVGRGQDDGLDLVQCWPALVPPVALSESEIHGAMVLFMLPNTQGVIPLAAELLRLGCDRQEFCYLEDAANGAGPVALLRAVKPPYYTLARALDRPEGLQAFVPSPPGQERIWTELGYHHTLASSLHAPKEGIRLIARDGWHTLPTPEWISLYKVLDIELPATAPLRLPVSGLAQVQRLRVQLQLRRLGRETSPTLWVLHQDGVEIVDRLVRQLPEQEIARLLFAVGGSAEAPVVLLRAREGRGKPPVLELGSSVLSCAPWLDLKNLYLPADAILEPPLRRETLRELLAPDADQLTWLAPVDPAFQVQRIDDDAFAPLHEWVEYVVHSEARALEPWIRATTFDFDAYESVGVEWSEGPAVAGLEPRKEEKKKKKERERPEPHAAASRAMEPVEEYEAESEPAPAELPPVVFELSAGSEEEQTLADLERRFLDLEVPAEAPERGELWLEMARLNTRLSRQRDAGLCWTRALWETTGQQERVTSQHWSVAEAMLAGDRSGGDAGLLDRLLVSADPAPQQVRTVASLLVRSRVAGQALDAARLYDVQGWLDANDRGLDVRSLWLAHLALSHMAGGDALQLTRTRDRILKRLFRGMSVESDVPTFLRFCGGGPGADTTTVGHLSAQLEQLLTRFGKTRRKRSAVEAPEELTEAYVGLIFANGFARLGGSERARALREQALAVLPADEPIHGFLRQAFAARVEHALEGLPAETPLPQEISGQLNQLERFVRYKVDRLRQASFILEPHEHLDPVLAFQQAKSDPRGEEFAPMRGMTDPRELSRAVEQVMQRALAPDTEVEDRDRLFDGVMDFFPMLPESESVPHLRTLVQSVEPIPIARRCMLLEEALMLSGFFGRGDMVQELVQRLKQLIGELGSEHVTEVASTLGQCLRSMRRVGLADEAGDLLTAVASAIKGSGTAVVVARLQLASGLADMGRMEQAQLMVQEGTKALKDKSLLLVDRLELTRAMASTVSHLPQAQAIGELQQLALQLPQITDSFNTNSHFCLSVIQFMESLILGYASEQLALGQLGRRWLDEDEYLVRRRIHRDLAQEQQ